MPASGKVLVDTSAWIAFFRKLDPCYPKVLQWLSEDRIVMAGIVLAELLQGAKSDREMSVLKDFKHIFSFLPESPSLWESAGLLFYRLRCKGITVGLSDCLIAVSAQEANASLYTLDAHFGLLKEEAGISLLSE